MTITYGSDLSGLDAPAIALKKTGIKFRHLFASDIDPSCRDVLALNYKIDKIYSDMTKVKVKEKPYVDFYLAGIVCTSFSSVGPGDGEGSSNKVGLIMKKIIEYINLKKPSVFIFENIKRFSTYNGGKSLENFLKGLNKSNDYELNWCILNSLDYGLPQTRSRIYIVGILKSKMKPGKSFTIPKPSSKQVHINTIIDPKEKGKPYEELSGYNKRLIAYLKNKYPNYEKKCWVSMLDQSESYARTFLNYSPTLLARHSNVIYLSDLKRCLTLKEVYRLQGFPDSYKKHPKKSHAFKHIGNSIPINVLVALIKEIKRISNVF